MNGTSAWFAGGLPGRTQTGVVITGDELHSAQTASFQALQEGSPMHFVLAQGHRNA